MPPARERELVVLRAVVLVRDAPLRLDESLPLEAVEGLLAEADAVVRGSITRYEPDLPVAYTGADTVVTVTRREVQITVSVEILDQRQRKPLWQRNGLTLRGSYESGNELEGREKALDDLVVNIVEGAQSQW
jgi:hypothetical protein